MDAAPAPPGQEHLRLDALDILADEAADEGGDMIDERTMVVAVAIERGGRQPFPRRILVVELEEPDAEVEATALEMQPMKAAPFPPRLQKDPHRPAALGKQQRRRQAADRAADDVEGARGGHSAARRKTK
jgi:hypothetical protein